MTKPRILSNSDPATAIHKELTIRCACGGDHFLVLQAESIDEQWIEVALVDAFTPHNFADFLKACWHLFRRGRYERSAAGINRTDLQRIAQWCNRVRELTQQ